MKAVKLNKHGEGEGRAREEVNEEKMGRGETGGEEAGRSKTRRQKVRFLLDILLCGLVPFCPLTSPCHRPLPPTHPKSAPLVSSSM